MCGDALRAAGRCRSGMSAGSAWRERQTELLRSGPGTVLVPLVVCCLPALRGLLCRGDSFWSAVTHTAHCKCTVPRWRRHCPCSPGAGLNCPSAHSAFPLWQSALLSNWHVQVTLPAALYCNFFFWRNRVFHCTSQSKMTNSMFPLPVVHIYALTVLGC